MLGAAVLDDKENESSNHFNGLLHQPGQEQDVFVLNIFLNVNSHHIFHDDTYISNSMIEQH